MTISSLLQCFLLSMVPSARTQRQLLWFKGAWSRGWALLFLVAPCSESLVLVLEEPPLLLLTVSTTSIWNESFCNDFFFVFYPSFLLSFPLSFFIPPSLFSFRYLYYFFFSFIFPQFPFSFAIFHCYERKINSNTQISNNKLMKDHRIFNIFR